MRTIKFRGKRIDNGEWVFGYFYRPNDGEECYIKNIDFAIETNHEVYKKTVSQFIGICDKSGKEIYGRDLVKAKRGNTSLGDMNDIYEIVWHDEYACFCYKCVKSDNFYRVGKIAESRSHPFFVTPKITEIIGNSFEHPNLLK